MYLYKEHYAAETWENFSSESFSLRAEDKMECFFV